MDEGNLIAETNALLKQLLGMEERHKAESAKHLEEFNDIKAQLAEKSRDALKERVRETGGDPALAEGTNEEWQERFQAVRQKSQERIEEARQKDEQFKAELLEELRIQTDLMRQIAERLAV